MRKRNCAIAGVFAAALLSAGPSFGVAAATTPTVTVVASNLDNPRGVAVVNGKLYVAEAGRGGTDCPTGATGPEGGPLCVGLTGSLAVIQNGVATPVLSGLFSMSDVPGGIAALGIAAVAGTKHGGLRVVFSESVVGVLTELPEGAKFTAADSAAARSQLGMLKQVVGNSTRTLADVGDADFVWSALHQDLVPDQFPDSNPNALAVVGNTTYVVDAGANTLVSVNKRGRVTQRAFFPNPPAADAVPTCVAVGPDRNLYIGQLAPGAPLNGGNVYKYDRRTGQLTVWQTGFNVVDGCGFDRAGNFYAVEFQAHGFNPGPTGNPAGDIIKITPNGTRSVLGAGQLFFPQGFAIDSSGNIYVSNWSIMTGTPAAPGAPTGQVVRVTQ
jgi:hypothetical protein